MKSEHAGRFAPFTGGAAFVNFGWLTIDKIIRLAAGLFIGMWVARYLGPAGYGILNYGIAVASLAIVLPGLGLEAIVRRELVRQPAQAGPILGTTFFLRLAAGVATYALLLVATRWLEPNAAARLAIAMAGLSLVQQSVMSIDLWFQSQLLSKYTVLAQLVSFALCSALRVAGILHQAPLEWFLYLLGVETVVSSVLLVSAYLAGRQSLRDWRWDRALARRLLGQSWPLALGTLATIVYVKFDQVLLRNLAGTAETGIYASAARIVEILYAVPLMLAASASPGLVRAHAANPEEYEHAMRRFFNFAAGSAWLLAGAMAVAAPWVVPLAFGPEYARATGMLMTLAFSLPLIAVGIARQEYLVIEGRQQFQLATTLVGAVVSIALNLWTIPRWGGLGAAWVTLASHFACDFLTSLCWPPARTVGRWQLCALAGWWRLPAAPVRSVP